MATDSTTDAFKVAHHRLRTNRTRFTDIEYEIAALPEDATNSEIAALLEESNALEAAADEACTSLLRIMFGTATAPKGSGYWPNKISVNMCTRKMDGVVVVLKIQDLGEPAMNAFLHGVVLNKGKRLLYVSPTVPFTSLSLEGFGVALTSCLAAATAAQESGWDAQADSMEAALRGIVVV